MKLTWTGRMQEWLFDHGIKTDGNGKMLIPVSVWHQLAFTDKSLRNPDVRTLCVPSDFGMTLLFENQHFYIVGG